MKSREINPALKKISDSEILLNFKSTLEKIYPNMVYINAQGYGPYDEIVEPLFRTMVFGAFADKYGVFIKESECWGYEFSPSVGEKIINTHIVVIPKSTSFSIIKDGKNEISAQYDPLGKILLFLNFGDATHSLTGGISQEEAKKINFDYSRCLIYDSNSKMILSEEPIWIKNDYIEFKYVSKLND